jgi:hypothetical protein
MSKQLAYEILRILGGPDTPSKPVHVKAIAKYCKEHYPDVYNDKYIHTGLGRLRHWKYITYDYEHNTYTIIEDYEAPNIHSSPITEDDIIAE